MVCCNVCDVFVSLQRPVAPRYQQRGSNSHHHHGNHSGQGILGNPPGGVCVCVCVRACVRACVRVCKVHISNEGGQFSVLPTQPETSLFVAKSQEMVECKAKGHSV